MRHHYFPKIQHCYFPVTVFIINADKDYAEGKKQNTLRPEDVEKIDYVFTNKIEEAKYSKLVDLDTIESNDYTLNIRRYVDNTPPPEPEDVKAHLIGGVPISEIENVQNTLSPKFEFDGYQLFQDKNERYKEFKVENKATIKQTVEDDKNVIKTLTQLGIHLADWWHEAKDEFSTLAPKNEDAVQDDLASDPMSIYLRMGGDTFPKVRKELLNSMKEKFVPVGVFDKFQVAGVFVNWWDNIKYDLKTIMQNGWDPGLIPNEYLIEEFFKEEKSEIEEIEIEQADFESQLEEAVEEALSLVEFEPDEEEGEVKQTPTLAKSELKAQIDYFLKEKNKPKEAKPYQEQDAKIKDLEKSIKDCKALYKEKQTILELKIELKRYGSEEVKAESNILLTAAKKEIENLDVDIESLIIDFKSDLKDSSDYDNIKKSVTDYEKELKKSKDKPEVLQIILEVKKQFKEITKTYNTRIKDSGILRARLNSLDALLEEIGGMITDEESQKLILKKHFDIINDQLQRYLNAEQRALVAAYENLFDKYYTSAQAIEQKREKTMTELNDFLTELNYLN